MTEKKKLIAKFFTVTCAVVLMLTALSGCAGEEIQEPIKFGDVGWDSVQVHNRIAGFIVENGYGYTAEYVPGETIPLFAALERGDIDIIMEEWIANQKEAYDKAIEAGTIIDLGVNFPDSWQGWLVPAYVIEGDPERGIEPMAPDLKTIEDLPKYWELFKDPEDPTKGRFLSCQAGWECERINQLKFEAYGLNEYYNVFMPGSNAALSGSLIAACEKGEPWFGYYWEPTWVLGMVDVIHIEEPAYSDEIWETTHACAYPSTEVTIVVNSEFPDKAPEIVDFLSKYTTTTAITNTALAYMQDSGASTSETAIWFLQEYEDLWTQWVPADIASKVKAALP